MGVYGWRRNMMRCCILLTAWSVGFLAYHTLGYYWYDGGVLSPLMTMWNNVADILQDRVGHSSLSRDGLSQILALTLGRREMLSPELKMIYRQAGASHLLALSGMHLGILYGMVIVFARRYMLGSYRGLVTALVLLLIWSYTMLSGAPKSLLRASLMLTVTLFCQISQRQYRAIDILVLAMAIVFLADPAAVMDIGFQFSCSAMLGIILLGMPLFDDTRRYQPQMLVVLRVLAISLSAQLFTVPLGLYHFGTIAPWAILVSLLAMPITTTVIYLSLFLYLFPHSDLLASAIDTLLHLQTGIMQMVV